MKRSRYFWGAALCLASLLVVLFAGMGAPDEVTAHAAGAYDYSLSSYKITYDVSSRCTIAVTEEITADFSGYASHGIIRDFALGGGVTYGGFQISCSDPDFSPYFKTENGDVLSLYLRGDKTVTGQSRTYTLSYTIHAFLVGGELPIDILPYGLQSEIAYFRAEVRLPSAARGVRMVSGKTGSKTDGEGFSALLQRSEDGTSYVLELKDLEPRYWDGNGNNVVAGASLAFTFDGSVKSPADLTALYAAIVALGLIASALLIRFLFCRRPLFTRTVNLTAPREMDPLLMGKFIDNSVDSEDVGSLVFYFASRGYLDIDITDQDDPLLIKRSPPGEEEPAYCKVLYDGLFRNRDCVRPSALKNVFYPTVQTVKSEVNVAASHMYSARGKVALALLGILAVLFAGGFVWLYGLLGIGYGYHYIPLFFASAFSYAVSAALSWKAEQRRYKWGRARRFLMIGGGFLLGLVPVPVLFLLPSAVTGLWTAPLLVAGAAATGSVAGNCLVYTKRHAELMGHILGFKDFLLFAEKDRLEAMLAEDPGLYYEILPYAQVLGVTEKWTEKFKGLDVARPAFVTGGADVTFSVLYWHNFSRMTTRGMAQVFISRPARTSVGGHGGFGGHIGGGGGGGFGGGGIRGC